MQRYKSKINNHWPFFTSHFKQFSFKYGFSSNSNYFCGLHCV